MNDKQQIDQLCKDFFDLFTNANGRVLWLDQIHSICIPQAIIIKKENEDEEVYDLISFIEPRKIALTDGTITDFTEWETEESTTIGNNIAQRCSHYQKQGKLTGTPFSQKGVKLFQFIKTDHEWRIVSVVWEDF